MNSRCQREALPTVKIRFDSAGATALGRVEMDGNENRVGIRVGDSNARSQWHEHITIAGHYYAIPASCQHLLQPLRDIQGHLFFCDPLAWYTAAVIATMTRINHNGRCRAALFRSSPRVSSGESPQKCNQQTGGKQIESAKICRHH